MNSHRRVFNTNVKEERPNESIIPKSLCQRNNEALQEMLKMQDEGYIQGVKPGKVTGINVGFQSVLDKRDVMEQNQ